MLDTDLLVVCCTSIHSDLFARIAQVILRVIEWASSSSGAPEVVQLKVTALTVIYNYSKHAIQTIDSNISNIDGAEKIAAALLELLRAIPLGSQDLYGEW